MENNYLLTSVSVDQYNKLQERVTKLEDLLREFVLKQRELAIIETSHVETLLGMPRTREKRK